MSRKGPAVACSNWWTRPAAQLYGEAECSGGRPKAAMLVIRRDQFTVFADRARQRFEDELVQTLAGELEPKFIMLGETEVRRLIGVAIERGAALGIVSQGAVAILVELMMQFGEHFELSPERRWAEKMLSHPTLPDYIRVNEAQKRMTAQMEGRVLMPSAAMPPAPEDAA